MLTNKDRKIAEQLKKRLLASDGARIQRVFLYGSRAKGTATKESDFDLLGSVKGVRNRFRRGRTNLAVCGRSCRNYSSHNCRNGWLGQTVNRSDQYACDGL
jgi:hypothetical protein